MMVKGNGRGRSAGRGRGRIPNQEEHHEVSVNQEQNQENEAPPPLLLDLTWPSFLNQSWPQWNRCWPRRKQTIHVHHLLEEIIMRRRSETTAGDRTITGDSATVSSPSRAALFSAMVIVDELPQHFRYPNIKEYNGKGDPDKHLARFENASLLH